MKKTFTTLALLAATTISVSAQEYNLFPASDVDADGWLWFDTQEKIDKYVGVCDEDNYTVDPNGKIIQMVYANITPDYPETIADPTVMGTDEAGYIEGQDEYTPGQAKTGAIVIAGASAQMSTNGGCLILNLPSCSTISLYLSSEASMLGRTMMISPTNAIDNDNSPAGAELWTGDSKVIYSRATLFGKLHGAGQFKWEGVESLNNGNNPGVTFVSGSPVYFLFQNCHKYPVYVHGIKVTTPKQESAGVSEIVAADGTDHQVYNLAGMRMKSAGKGLYIQDGKVIAAGK
jgi:hypothetical protein